MKEGIYNHWVDIALRRVIWKVGCSSAIVK